jgi:hypothetical protein
MLIQETCSKTTGVVLHYEGAFRRLSGVGMGMVRHGGVVGSAKRLLEDAKTGHVRGFRGILEGAQGGRDDVSVHVICLSWLLFK